MCIRDSMSYAFSLCTSLTTVDLSGLSVIGQSALANIFYGCTSLTTVDLSSLSVINARTAMSYAFYSCTSLTTVDLSSLTEVSGIQAMQYAFQMCHNLTSVNLSGLTQIGANASAADYGHFAYAFYNCDNLTSITFPNLELLFCTGGTSTSYGTFANNNYIRKMYFPKLKTITYGSGASSTNQKACLNVFYGCSALTELHFSAANKSRIQATPGYSTAWGRGAGNVTIYFDL